MMNGDLKHNKKIIMRYLCEMKLKYGVLGCIFSLFFIANSETVSAQEYYYKGKVADHQSEEPLPFVALSYIKDKKGVVTDSVGNFMLLKSIF